MAHMKNLLMNDNALPIYPPYGMTPAEFAEAQKRFTDFARERILGGASEYDKNDHQRMEEMGAQEIVKELREELADAVNYLTGLDLYLARIPWLLVDELH